MGTKFTIALLAVAALLVAIVGKGGGDRGGRVVARESVRGVAPRWVASAARRAAEPAARAAAPGPTAPVAGEYRVRRAGRPVTSFRVGEGPADITIR
ncbi:MAG: hypothetical protein ACT4PV_06725 [Planctomycetaceae bacterium]